MASADPATIPPEVIQFASRMYNAARAGDKDVFEQALPRGLPPNMTNEKGDTLVRNGLSSISYSALITND